MRYTAASKVQVPSLVHFAMEARWCYPTTLVWTDSQHDLMVSWLRSLQQPTTMHV